LETEVTINMGIKERIKIEQHRKFENFKMCTRDFESIKLEDVYSKDELYVLKVNMLNANYLEPYMMYFAIEKCRQMQLKMQMIEKV